MDRDKVQPFARLFVHVGKARRLLAADMNGRSDPYVSLSLDDSDVLAETVCVMSTLAPCWNESFTLDVYHPKSLLYLNLLDWDLKVLSEVTGQQDNDLGYVKIQLGKFPFNQEVSGWWDVTHPLGNGEYAGALQLRLELRCRSLVNEFFACCLPPPKVPNAQHGDVDMGAMFKHSMVIAEILQDFVDRFQRVCERIENNPLGPMRHLVLYLIIILFVWRPILALPVLVYIVGTLLWIAMCCSGSRSPEDKNGQAASGSKKTDPLLTGSPDVEGGNKSEKTSKLQRQPTMRGQAARKAKKIMSQEDVDRIASKLSAFGQRGLGLVLQGDDNQQILSGLADINDLITVVVQGIEYATLVLNNRGLKMLVMSVFALVFLLPIICRQTQLILLPNLLLQIGISLYMTVWLWTTSPFARLMVGITTYDIKGRNKAPSLTNGHQSDDSPTSPSRSTSRNLFGVFPEGADTHQKVLYKHDLKSRSYYKPAWCDACGKLLVGLVKQGYRCRACKADLCPACASDPDTPNDCPGQEPVGQP